MKHQLLLAASLLACTLSQAATFLPLDAKATYLHTFDDSPTPPPAFALNLASLGFFPGSRITLQVVGDVDNGPSGDTFTYTLGVFSSSAVLLGNEQRERVVGALATDAPAVLSSPTFRGARPTDIAQDFGFDIGVGITVTVPTGATTLFLAKSDQWYHDNSDPDGDYGVLIGLAPIPEPGTWALMLAGMVGVAGIARRRSRDDRPDPAALHSAAPHSAC
jgi:hypothetical protein